LITPENRITKPTTAITAAAAIGLWEHSVPREISAAPVAATAR
jgi:hypothetical protein